MGNAAAIVHAKVSTAGATVDPAKVGGPDWNAGHLLTGLEQVDNTSDANKPISTATNAALIAITAARPKVVLTADTTFYVRSANGSDSNTGLTNDAAGAWATLAKARNKLINEVYLNGFNATIDITGAFTTGVNFSAPFSGVGTVTLTSSGGATITTTSANGIAASYGCAINVTGSITFSTVTAGIGLIAYAGGSILYSGLTFSTCAGVMVQAGWVLPASGGNLAAGPGTTSQIGACTIAGNAIAYLHSASEGSKCHILSGVNTVLSGTPAFSSWFVGAGLGKIFLSGATFSGTGATGLRYGVHNGGCIFGAVSKTSLPGSLPGYEAAGGGFVIDDNTNFYGFGALVLGNTTAFEVGTNTLVNFNAQNAVSALPPSTNTAMHVVGADGASTAATFVHTYGATVFLGAYRADGTLASKSAVAAGVQIYAQQAGAWDGSAYSVVATFDALTLNLQSGTDHSGYWRWRTIPSGSTTLAEGGRLQPSGGVAIGGIAWTANDYGAGNLAAAGGIASAAATTKTANYTMTVADSALIFNGAGSLTLTLLSAASYPGRWIIVRTIAAQTVVSASSNVVPLAGGAAGTAILAATAGKWAWLQSDGANWQIMAAN